MDCKSTNSENKDYTPQNDDVSLNKLGAFHRSTTYTRKRLNYEQMFTVEEKFNQEAAVKNYN